MWPLAVVQVPPGKTASLTSTHMAPSGYSVYAENEWLVLSETK